MHLSVNNEGKFFCVGSENTAYDDFYTICDANGDSCICIC